MRRWRANGGEYTWVESSVVSSSEVEPWCWKRWPRSPGANRRPGETPGGGAHGDAERDPGGAQASMATGRRGAPLGAWKEAQDVEAQPMDSGEAPGGGA
jgi:hypothetical protein